MVWSKWSMSICSKEDNDTQVSLTWFKIRPFASSLLASGESSSSTLLTVNISTLLAVWIIIHSSTPGIFLNSSHAAETSFNSNFYKECIGTFLKVTRAFITSKLTLPKSSHPHLAVILLLPPWAVRNTFIPIK